MSEAPVLTHQPCPACGSTDAAVVFANGGTYCYSCLEGTKGDGSPPETASPFKAEGGLIDVAVMGVPKRSIPETTAQRWGYGYGEFKGRKCQVATYCDERGRPVAQKLRFAGKQFSITGEAAKMGLYGSHLFKSGGKSITVTEGELDALSVSAAWEDRWPVVSLPNGVSTAVKVFQRNIEFLERFEKVVLMFDQDEPGRAAAEAAAAVLTPGKAWIATLPGKDANELLMAGRAEDIVRAFWDAKPWRPDGIVSGPTVWQRVLARDNAAFAPIPHAGLNDKWMGFRPGEISVLVAGTGSGKSTTCREWATALAKAGHKIGYIGLEEPIEMTAMGLASVCVSRPLHLLPREELSKPDVLEAATLLEERVVYYDHHGVKADTDLLAKMKFMAQAEKCRLIVFDHLSIVISGGDLKDDERRTIDKMLTQLASFGQQTDVHVLAVCHLSRREGKPHEEGRPVTLADLRGSHGISQLAFNVASIERDQQAPTEAERDTSTVRSLKCRWTGRTGVAGYVRYMPETGRQIEIATKDTDSPFDDAGSDDVT